MAFIGNTPTTQAFTPAVDVFSGNGSTTAFTLSRPVASVAQVQAFIENVPQSPVDAFTVSGNTITFTSAPPSGSSNIYVRYTSPITQVMQPTDGSVGTNQLAAGAVTPAKMAAGAAVSNIGAGGITANEIASNAVTFAKLLSTDWANSKATNGYQKLPSGLIIQWGQAVAPSQGQTTVTFPIAFPNAAFAVVVSGLDTYAAVRDVGWSSLTTSSFIMANSYSGGGATTGSFVAFGY